MSGLPVLTVHEPYAWLIAHGLKTIETRSRRTNVRGRIAIHAAAAPIRHRVEVGPFEVWPPDPPGKPHPNWPQGRPARIYRNDVGLAGASWAALTFGAIVATADLIDCLPIIGWRDCKGSSPDHVCAPPPAALYRHLPFTWAHGVLTEEDRSGERDLGNYTPGRWAWLLSNVEVLSTPVPFKGGQGWSRRWTQ
jgi:activating signal cointegrator 1